MTQGSDGHPVGGRYRLVRQVGRGAMGTVWQARDEQLGRIVAIKQLASPPGDTPEERTRQVERFKREAQMAARLDHPGIVRVYDVIDREGLPAIVMEYVEGRSLGARLRECGKLSVAETARLGVALLDALRHAHAAGVVHRDLKPDNILIAGTRTVITDFGIARPLEPGATLTMPGAMIGTPAYMAPEQIEGKEATPAADLWSLGVTLYTAVEGTLPFEGETIPQMCVAVLTRPMRPTRSAGPLTPLLHKLLTKDPTQRAIAVSAALHLTAITPPTSTPAGSTTVTEIPTVLAPRPGTTGLQTTNGAADSMTAEAHSHPTKLYIATHPDSPGNRSAAPRIEDPELAAATRRLAQEMRARWEQAEEDQGLADTRPMRVRWKQAPANLRDQPANISEAPLPETGDLDEIEQLYRQLPSGRLVVLGGAGSGKTTLTMRFALKLLKDHPGIDKIPVIFNIAPWDPTVERSLRDWLARQLERDYALPFLAKNRPDGTTFAAALVAADLILPVLDGFDEIGEGLRPAALEALNDAARMPMILTSRTYAYAGVVEGTRGLTRAACVEMVDLTLTDLEDYLHSSAPGAETDGTGGPRTAWHRVMQELREHPLKPARPCLQSGSSG